MGEFREDSYRESEFLNSKGKAKDVGKWFDNKNVSKQNDSESVLKP